MANKDIVHMERLSFDESNLYSALEGSIHVARYSLAKAFCKGATVLDIACGEGYGSHLLSSWGASEVHGVDVSDEAVTRARSMFGNDKCHFWSEQGERICSIFQDQTFDLIVSIETIEHVRNSGKFLDNLKRLLKPSGVLVLTCPNDYWMFPDDEVGNPYHLRKYSYQDFFDEAQMCFGEPTQSLLGVGLNGFGCLSLPLHSAGTTDGQNKMLTSSQIEAELLSGDIATSPDLTTASFYIGIWGGEVNDSAVLYPVSMKKFESLELKDYIKELEDKVNFLRGEGSLLLAKEIESNKYIKELEDKVNFLRGEGSLLLAKEIESNKYIKELEDKVNFLRGEGSLLLAKEIESHKYIKELEDKISFLKDEGRTIISKLESLRLEANEIIADKDKLINSLLESKK